MTYNADDLESVLKYIIINSDVPVDQTRDILKRMYNDLVEVTVD